MVQTTLLFFFFQIANGTQQDSRQRHVTEQRYEDYVEAHRAVHGNMKEALDYAKVNVDRTLGYTEKREEELESKVAGMADDIDALERSQAVADARGAIIMTAIGLVMGALNFAIGAWRAKKTNGAKAV